MNHDMRACSPKTLRAEKGGVGDLPLLGGGGGGNPSSRPGLAGFDRAAVAHGIPTKITEGKPGAHAKPVFRVEL